MMNVFVVDCTTPRSLQTQHSLLLLVCDSFDAQHLPLAGFQSRIPSARDQNHPLFTQTRLSFGFFEHGKVALARVLIASLSVMY